MKGKKTLSQRLTLLIAVLVPLAIFYTLVGIWGTRNIQMKSRQYTGSLLDVYVSDIDEKIKNINRKLGLLFLAEGEAEQDVNMYLEAIRTTDNEAYRNYYIERLKRIFDSYSQEYGMGYHFFAYYPEQGWYVENQNELLTLREAEKFANIIKEYFARGESLEGHVSQSWKLCADETGRSCMIRYYKMEHNYLGCWIRPEDIIRPLRSAVDEEGAILLYNKSGELVTGWGEAAYDDCESFVQRYGMTVIERDFKELPFHIRFLIAGNGMFGTVLTMQLLMMVSAIAMLVVVLSSVAYLYQKVLIPVRKFSRNLEMIQKGEGEPEELADSQLEELQITNGELAGLFRKINILEDEIQQQEMEKQKMQLDYLKLQIRPHFYLNCLNFIYNMIDLGKEQMAKQMAHYTADYMRYLLKDDLSMVHVREEIEHVKNYLEIQKLRLEEKLEYYIDWEKNIEDAWIPHMLIQPFVENCIKYAADSFYKIVITITVYEEVWEGLSFISICISDTGAGFSNEFLNQLNSGQTGTKGKIGIANTQKRLKHYYGEHAETKFYNGPGKGAIVEIHIPCSFKAGGEEHETFTGR